MNAPIRDRKSKIWKREPLVFHIGEPAREPRVNRRTILTLPFVANPMGRDADRGCEPAPNNISMARAPIGLQICG